MNIIGDGMECKASGRYLLLGIRQWRTGKGESECPVPWPTSLQIPNSSVSGFSPRLVYGFQGPLVRPLLAC
eukprot:1160627-Pelagomonas_calceolata.AAC.9